jgi:hypothetical protein
MNYYILSAHYPDDSMSVTGLERAGSIVDSCDARHSKLLDTDYLSHFEFKIMQYGKLYDLLANNLGWHLILSSIGEEIRKVCLSDELQFLPFEPIGSCFSEGGLHSYELVNVLKELDCIDTKRSSLRMRKNDIGKNYISAIHDLRINKELIPEGINIFRLSQFKSYVIVNEKLAHLIDRFCPITCSFSLIRCI